MERRNGTALYALFKVLGWALAGLAGLLVVAVLVTELMPLNFLKGPVGDRVEAMTGRELEISGDISVSLLPRPHLEVGGLNLANAGWGRAQEMLVIDGLELEPSLTRLFRGELALKYLTITGPTINLEGRKGKPGNWVLPAMTGPGGTAGGSENGGQDTGDQAGPALGVDQIDIRDGEIRYFSPGREQPQVLSLGSLTLAGDRLSLGAEADVVMGGERLVLPGELSATTDPGFADGHWRLHSIQARVGEVRIDGDIGVDTGASPPVVTAELHSPSFNVTNMLAALPESQGAAPPAVSMPVLPSVAGDIRLTIDQVILKPATFEEVKARIRPGRHELVLETLKFKVAGGRGEASGRLGSDADFITAQARLDLRRADLQALGLAAEPGKTLDAELELGLEELPQAPSLGLRTLLEHLDIGVARASYRAPQQDEGAGTDLDLILEEAAEPPAAVLSVNGRFKGRGLDLSIEGAPLVELLEEPADYRLEAQAQSGGLSAWADTRLGALLTPGSLAGDLVLEGNGGQALETWVGTTLPPLPGFRLSGRLDRDGDVWSVTALDGTVGVTELGGEVRYRHGDSPEVDVDLQAGRIELAQFTGGDSQPGPSSTDGNGPDQGSPLAALRTFDGRLNLRAQTLVLPGTPDLTDLQLVASLDAGRLEIEPLNFHVAGGSWGSSLALDATSQPASGTVDAELDAIALGRFGDTFTPIEDRLGRLSGELRLGITETLAVDHREELPLPFIGRLTVEPSRLTFKDPQAATDMTLELRTRGLGAGDQVFQIDGRGQYDGSPFSLRFRGDPLLAARDPDRSYALELSSDVVDSRIHVQGSILQPLALKGLDLGLDLEGPNPHRLSRLLGIPLPILPPYSLSGDLSLRDGLWTLGNIEGQVGDSDLGGRIAFDVGPRPPHLTGELNSDSLHLEDLGVLAGAEPVSAEQPSPDSKAKDARKRHVLPDRPLVTAAWQNVSADIRYRGTSVQAAAIPLSNVVIDFKLADGHGRFSPVRFGVGDGQVDFDLDIDSKLTPPGGTVQLEVQAVDLKKALSDWSLANDSVGTVGGQGKFWVTGSSIADLFGSADGGLVMLMTRGRLDALLVELAGLDATQSFLSWLRARDPIPIDCAYIDVQTRDGVATVDTLAIDTTDTTFTGTGTVNLNDERLDITLSAHPKDVSVLAARTPFHLGGTFHDPEATLQTGGLAWRSGGSAALAALAGPIAALLPLLDLGTGEEAPYCDGLASRSLEAIDDAREGEDESDNH